MLKRWRNCFPDLLRASTCGSGLFLWVLKEFYGVILRREYNRGMRKYVPDGAKLLPKEAKKVFSGVISEVYQWPQKLFDGTTATFEMIKRPDTVKIVAILTPEEVKAAGLEMMRVEGSSSEDVSNVEKAGDGSVESVVTKSEAEAKVVITEQEQPRKDVFYDIPGGRVDEEDESELAAAKRELYEETGLKMRNWKLIAAVQPFNKIDWIVYTFVATGLIEKGEQSLDGGERIEVMAIGFEDLLRLENAPEARHLEAGAGSLEELLGKPGLCEY